MEQLQRRVETLENMFMGQGLLWQRMWHSISGIPNNDGLNNEPTEVGLSQLGNSWKEELLRLSKEAPEKESSDVDARPAAPGGKRRKLNRQQTADRQPLISQSMSDSTDDDLPPAAVIHELVDFYFANHHHWIPVLHVHKFREQLTSQSGRARAIHILHAIVAACLRFSTNPQAGTEEAKAQMALRCRQRVILNSMESFSVENLQALVIIAFDTVSYSLSIPPTKLNLATCLV